MCLQTHEKSYKASGQSNSDEISHVWVYSATLVDKNSLELECIYQPKYW